MPRKKLTQSGELDADVQQITEALAKIHDPLAKYFFAMFIDLMAERIAVLVDSNELKPGMHSLADIQGAFVKTAQGQARHN